MTMEQQPSSSARKPQIRVSEVPKLVLDGFLQGTPAKEMERIFNAGRTTSPGGTYFGYELKRSGPMAPKGTWRFSYTHDGFLMSYAMRIAYRTKGPDGKQLILVNGDGAPTKATNEFMRQLRRALVERNYDMTKVDTVIHAHAFIPFSVLQQAHISPRDVRVIATTPDRVEEKTEPPSAGYPTGRVVYHHYLGETLFTSGERVFVCGLDRNDDPSRRMFYMCQIPVKGTKSLWPETVDEALAMLRPEGLPESALRQGEWFFVPVPEYSPPSNAYRMKGATPIISDHVEEQQRARLEDGSIAPGVAARGRRHVATSMALDGSVFAKGLVRDAEHTTLKLGGVWHRVVKNLAVEGWRYTQKGIQVD